MSDTEKDAKTKRSQQAEKIIAELEAEYEFSLPKPWHNIIPILFLQGMNESGLHRIFQTVMQVEHEAGRLEVRPDKPLSFDD